MQSHADKINRFTSAGIYFVTSESLSGGRTTVEVVSAAIAGGVSLVQIREKDFSCRRFNETAQEVRRLTDQAGALMIINDRLDIALATGADGVHLGQDDLPIGIARKIAPDMIIGASTHSVKEAVAAQEAGASYVNIGPIYPTGTKLWKSNFLGVDGLKAISREVRIPFTVMGGIKASNIPELKRAGARIFAVVTAISAAEDPRIAARELIDQANLDYSREGNFEK